MSVRTLTRLVMAGLLLLGGVLAVLGGMLESGEDPIDGPGQVLWLAGVTVGLFGVGAGGAITTGVLGALVGALVYAGVRRDGAAAA